MRDGVATGIVVDGREMTAKAVISTLDPKPTLIGLIGAEHLDAETLELIPTAKSTELERRGLLRPKELPDYTAAPGKDPMEFPHRAAQIICPSLESPRTASTTGSTAGVEAALARACSTSRSSTRGWHRPASSRARS